MRVLLAVICAVAAVAGAHRAAAQDDGGIIKLVVPYVPGGFPDTVARIVAAQLGTSGKASWIVENRPGGAGVIAAEAVAKAPPDGRTLLVADAQQWAIAPQIVKGVTYDIERDFAPVSQIATTGNYLAVNAGLPAKDFKEFLALVREKPNAYNYGIPGVGSLHHLIFEVLLQRIGAKITQVPYKGGGEVGLALTNGQVQMAVQALPSILARAKEGKIRILGVVTARRSPLAPEIPTLQELGVKDIDFPGGLGILAPARTPPAAVERLATTLKAAVHAQPVVDKLKVIAVEPVGSSPAEFGAYIRAEYKKFGDAARAAGIRQQ